jgi:NAD(P)-dependent dehydrogenase (short-subunit alcohol dehydrogenase family)
MSSSLSNHVGVVTAGVPGIGLAICDRLIGEGVRVAAGFSCNGRAAEAFLDDTEATGRSFIRGRSRTLPTASGWWPR